MDTFFLIILVFWFSLAFVGAVVLVWRALVAHQQDDVVMRGHIQVIQPPRRWSDDPQHKQNIYESFYDQDK